MVKVEFFHSWADTIAQAQEEHGERGRRMALALRASQAGSKRIQSSYLEEAGYNVDRLLEWAGEPYSSLGLAAAAAKLYEYLSDEENEL